MYARVISMSNATAESRDRAIQVIRERVIPTVSQHDGYAGYIGLFDVDNQRAQAVLFWASREAADAAEKELVGFRSDLISGLGMSIESVDLYEAVIVEMA